MTATLIHGAIAVYAAGCRCDECQEGRKAYHKVWRAQRLTSPDFQHGRRVSYLCGCRCDSCRKANADYNLTRKARLVTSFDVPHGTVDGYGSYGCRCNQCAAAKRDATRDHYIRNQLRFLEKAERRAAWKDRDRRAVTARDIRRLFDRFDSRCAYCCKPSDHMEIDHVVPLSRGGRHAIGNLLPACRTCNRRKSARLLIEWSGRPR